MESLKHHPALHPVWKMDETTEENENKESSHHRITTTRSRKAVQKE
jgi:hypothetical protein